MGLRFTTTIRDIKHGTNTGFLEFFRSFYHFHIITAMFPLKLPSQCCSRCIPPWSRKFSSTQNCFGWGEGMNKNVLFVEGYSWNQNVTIKRTLSHYLLSWIVAISLLILSLSYENNSSHSILFHYY